MGGTIRAIEQGYFQRAMAESAYNYAKRKESGDQVVVHRIDPEAEARQIKRLRNTRARRNNSEVERLLDRLAAEAESPSTNLLPVTMELVMARASMGEIVQRLRGVYGSYAETPVF